MNWTTAQLADHYKRMGASDPIGEACAEPGEKRHKYNAKKTEVDGIVFDSAREAMHYTTLKLAQEHGLISDLTLQPRFLLQPKQLGPDGKVRHRAVYYVADFQFHRGGKTVVVDVKGFFTPIFRLKEKLFAEKYPDLTLEVWK